MNYWLIIVGVVVVALLIWVGYSRVSAGGEAVNVLRHTMTDINGEAVDLAQYEGQVVMIVNVASKCGFTPQYEALEALYQEYKDRGFVILGFPANDFMGQEPGTDEEILEFCSLNYGVTFPMFSKVSVLGRNKAPLYDDLVSRRTNPDHGGMIKWNFTKFLIGRDGKPVARFAPTTEPNADDVIEALERALDVQAESPQHNAG